MQEEGRVKKGLKPRLWIALYKCIRWILVLHGILYGLEVRCMYYLFWCIKKSDTTASLLTVIAFSSGLSSGN